jgi:Na+-translocating ferredoxin:NAD+ oxidoreductase RnfA subunit
MNLVTRTFSLLKHTAACLFFTKGALSGIQQSLGHRLHMVMLCAERGRDREIPVTLKGAEISKDTFLTFKHFSFLFFSLSVGMGVKLGLLWEGLQLAEGVREYGEGKLFGQQKATADWRK